MRVKAGELHINESYEIFSCQEMQFGEGKATYISFTWKGNFTMFHAFVYSL